VYARYDLELISIFGKNAFLRLAFYGTVFVFAVRAKRVRNCGPGSTFNDVFSIFKGRDLLLRSESQINRKREVELNTYFADGS